MPDDLITMKDSAAILNVSWQRVQQLVGEGKLRSVATNAVRRTLFRRTDVERLRLERGVGRFGRT